MSHITKRGYVYCHVRGVIKVKWTKRWCVLQSLEDNASTKLDFYESENDSSKKHPSLTILLSDVIKVDRKPMKEKENVFEVLTKERGYMFSTESEHETGNWVKVIESMKVCNVPTAPPRAMEHGNSQDSLEEVTFDENILYEAAEKPEIYPVEVVENEMSRKCNLRREYLLNINTMNISLSTRQDHMNAKYVFPFRYIRRYGKSSSSFTFEAGRKCLSGEGIFVLRTSQSNEILTMIQSKINSVKKRQSNNNLSGHSPNLSERKSPKAPPRKLGVPSYENMPKPNKLHPNAATHVPGSASDSVNSPKKQALATKRPVVPRKPSSIRQSQDPNVDESKALYATPDEAEEDPGYGSIYSSTDSNKLETDAWKNQGVVQIMHEENYGNMQKSSPGSSRFSGTITKNAIDEIADGMKDCMEDQDEESYDRLNFKERQKLIKNDNGSGSTYASVGKSFVVDDEIYSADTYEDAEPINFSKGDEYDYVGHGQLPDRK